MTRGCSKRWGATSWSAPPLAYSGSCLLLGRCCCGGTGCCRAAGGRRRRGARLRVVDLPCDLVDHLQLIGLHHEVLGGVVVVDLVVPGLRYRREARDLGGVCGGPRRINPNVLTSLAFLIAAVMASRVMTSGVPNFSTISLR